MTSATVQLLPDPAPELRELRRAVAQAVVGKDDAIELALVAVLAGGHLLIEDTPGVGKTTLARALARACGLTLQRVTFTSDLLPTDLLGVSVYDRTENSFRFEPGPIFTQLFLADEINRASPRTQSALLEAMNEGQVSVDGATRPLPVPFCVIATQNPLDHAGTYPLPESQLDRFLLRLQLGYPAAAVEAQLLLEPNEDRVAKVPAILDAAALTRIHKSLHDVAVDPTLATYLQAILTATRNHPGISVGASTRAGIGLVRAARARALLRGRGYAVPDDFQILAPSVLAHRIRLTSQQQGFLPKQGEAEELIRGLVRRIPAPV